MIPWLVIGAGPHGVRAATALAERHGADAVHVVDPHHEPLVRWERQRRSLGMRRLRSPWVHHCGDRAGELRAFAPSRSGTWTPPVEVFEDHARQRWAHSGVRQRQGVVVDLRREGRGWRVGLADGGSLHATRVVAAPGLAPHARAVPEGVHRVPSDAPPQGWEVAGRRVAVIGGGHSAATAALSLLEVGAARVDLLAPGGLRAQQTDVDPGWFGPKHLRDFWRADVPTRWAQLAASRVASVTPSMRGALDRARQAGSLRLRPIRVLDAHATAEGSAVHLRGTLADDRAVVLGPYARAFAATGFAVSVRNVPWLARLDLPTLGGLPCLDRRLAAAPRLHVLGALAELELGPAGRNLWGAMRAAERLVEV